MLGSFATVDSAGLITIVGGGITNLGTPVLPGQLTVGVAIQASSTPRSEATTYPLLVEFKRPNGTGATRLAGQMEVSAGAEHSNLAFNVPVLVDVAGRWTVAVSFGEGEPTSEVWFNVVLASTQ
jgi:hypothetical protein